MAYEQNSIEPFPMLVGYDSKKAAQVAAFFSVKNGGRIEKLKLIKLMYLSERQSMAAYNRPMFYDEHYSLKDGPICSNTLNAINGGIDQRSWGKYVARGGNIVVPVKKIERDDMDEVSDADIEVIEAVWKKVGHMNASQIRNYTHEHCPEYKEVKSGRVPINYKEIYEALGKPNAADLADQVAQYRGIEVMFRA